MRTQSRPSSFVWSAGSFLFEPNLPSVAADLTIEQPNQSSSCASFSPEARFVSRAVALRRSGSGMPPGTFVIVLTLFETVTARIFRAAGVRGQP